MLLDLRNPDNLDQIMASKGWIGFSPPLHRGRLEISTNRFEVSMKGYKKYVKAVVLEWAVSVDFKLSDKKHILPSSRFAEFLSKADLQRISR